MLRWMFLDLDSYFAGVEQQLEPGLRGKPVGVVPVESKGTCCIAASKEAKRCGVKTGTKVADAERLCPGIELVKARPALYIAVHKRIKAAIETVLPVDKVWSIDEVAIRLWGREREPAVARGLAERVKAAVRAALVEITGEYAAAGRVAARPSPQNLSASVGLGAGWGGAGSAWGAVERLRERMGDGRYRRTGAVRAGQPLRVAVTVSGLTPVTATAGNLFAQAEDRRGLGGVMDAINTRFGGHTLYLGGMHAIADREMEDKIAFGRVPDERVGI
ncbi:MAG: hypothetical protein AAF797_13540 [Planctomycetota bacterium]